MIVDPATGLPIEDPAIAADPYEASNMFVDAGLNSYAANPTMSRAQEHFFAGLGHIPASTAVLGVNAMRTSNTILGGGWSSNPGLSNVRGSFRANNFLNPKTWFSLPSVTNIDTAYPAGTKDKHYTPFNMLAKWGNWDGKAGKHLGGAGLLNKAVNKVTDEPNWAQRAMGRGVFSQSDIDNRTLFNGGFVGRVTAAGRLGGTDALSARKVANISSFLRPTDPQLWGTMDRMLKFDKMTGNMASESILMSGRGAISQYAGGYISGARIGTNAGMTPMGFMSYGTEMDDVARRVGKTSYAAGRRKAAEHLGFGGLKRVEGKLVTEAGEAIGKGVIKEGFKKAVATGGIKAGGKYAAALGVAAASGGTLAPVVGAVMTAWTAYDLTMMGIDFAKAAFASINVGSAMTSLQGDIAKPLMGAAYKDNTVAATSRQRGVMAIQNSRLNARSILGSEAAPMFAHFG